MRLVRVPVLIGRLFPDILWSFPNEKGKLFLTFDDGPSPDATPFVLDQLKRYQAKATFFCLGRQVEKHKDLYKSIISEGHSVGNHSFSHPKPLSTPYNEFMSDISRAAALIDSNLFRPPYGKMKWKQYRALRKIYKIVLWDVISYDYDKETTADQCFGNIIKNARDGSIIVLHDAPHAFHNLHSVLPDILEYYSSRNFDFEAIV